MKTWRVLATGQRPEILIRAQSLIEAVAVAPRMFSSSGIMDVKQEDIARVQREYDIVVPTP